MPLKRRSFLKSLLSVPVALLHRPAIARSPDRGLLLNRFSIAGFRYYQGTALLPILRPGQTLQLRAEPDNPHDAFAVRIEWNGRKLGYVPRRIVGVVALESNRHPGSPARKVHLVLDDGTFFEFYGSDLDNAKGCKPCTLGDPRWTMSGEYTIVQEFWEEGADPRLYEGT
ncbi:HIRAN domain-containing protein [Geothermobacter ehrlichii]|uniref:HIRAN domain-containing protein n=2 Tax=Geothermobacter ehrlichii TaxID=213224 RepID=A0A5D3WHQ7_9BACT|nr:HIRAN domain-containing protein [Geothermobacter ehrlichii]